MSSFKNPLDYISKYSNDNTQTKIYSREVIAVFVFICIYITIRLIERYITPRIPMFFITEIKNLYSWGLFLIPLIIGYASCKSKKIITNSKYK